MNAWRSTTARLTAIGLTLVCAPPLAQDAVTEDRSTGSTAPDTQLSPREERRAARRAESEARRAAESAAEARRTEAADAAEEPKLICRRESEVGSHFKVRRCYTPDQLEGTREDSQEFMRDTMRSRRQVGEPNG